jgi:flavin reductase (DIM6/NTAB) family NADH-FMN oxidoreductase RutF
MKVEEESMKKDLGVIPAIYPMPVLMIAAYDENGKVNVMNAAWGQVCDMDKIILFLAHDRKTLANMKVSGAFSVSLADVEHVAEADYFGLVSGNRVEDKFERTGLHAEKSDKVNAPVIEEFPVVMECELVEIVETENVFGIVGKIVNTKAKEEVLDRQNRIDVRKLHALIFDQFRSDYNSTGEQVAKAWNAGLKLTEE